MLKISVIALTLTLLFLSNKTHAGEKSLYDFLWLDPDKKVYVLQNKLYKKEHTVYADLGYLSNFTSKFQDTRGLSVKVGYYIHEEWGVEVFYNQYQNQDNDDYRSVRAIASLDPFVRRMKSTYGALAIWSPFYGKINTFNQIYYFDWSFGVGLGKVNTESNLKTVGALNAAFADESYSAAIWKTNVKFHVRENVHLGVEWMQQHFRAPGAKNPKKDDFRSNQDLIISLGFSF